MGSPGEQMDVGLMHTGQPPKLMTSVVVATGLLHVVVLDVVFLARSRINTSKSPSGAGVGAGAGEAKILEDSR